MITGVHDEYQWLAADHEIDLLVRAYPQVVLGKYLAVTAVDSGPFMLDDKKTQAGWVRRGDIAFSPQIQNTEYLPEDGFTEWYAFDGPIGGAQTSGSSVFDTAIEDESFEVFVNHLGFGLHVIEMQSMVDQFWRQIRRIRPESYVADGSCLTFVSRNASLFTSVCRSLEQVPPRWYRGCA